MHTYDAPELPAQIARFRQFNRFYTRYLGLLDEGLLRSELSLSEARILFEIAHQHALTASDIRNALGLDAGYLSRILRTFEERGWLLKTPRGSDARQMVLSLTADGEKVFAALDTASEQQIASVLTPLEAPARREILTAMAQLEAYLSEDVPARAHQWILRSLRPGDIGWIIHRQAILYARDYGWDQSYEGLVAEILLGFQKAYRPDKALGLVAEKQGQILGSVFVMPENDTTARLRLLYVDSAARGLGLGRSLVDEAIRFATQAGYETLILWTNSVLTSARRIYEAAGFRLLREEAHHSFGKDLLGQDWELPLKK